MRTETKQPWVAIVTMPPTGRGYKGNGREILLQGFHWESHAGWVDPTSRRKKTWYQIVKENAGAVRAAGFNWVWMPPSDSLAPQGYIPRRWHSLDSAYGSEQELREALEALGPVKAMADVVLNHRVGAHTGGADFEEPPFPDNRAAIVRDDESGVGTGNPDTGDRHPCGRDLDHTNPGVRAAIKTYLRGLLNVGYRGFRYDLVKGFHGSFVGEYNDASGPEFSVGECFDGDRQKVIDWIDATGGKSTAFDFPTRYLLYDATLTDDYGRLRANNQGRAVPGGLMGFWSSRAVTFLDNHDTEYRREKDHEYNNDNTRHFSGPRVDMGYAYLLTHPGVPCVFWPHFFDFGEATRRRITQLVCIRKALDIHSASHVDVHHAERGLYAATIDGKVAVKLGSRGWWPGGGWNLAVDGERFAVWTR